MLSVLYNVWNQRLFLCGKVFAVLVICCVFDTSAIVFAQQKPRPVAPPMTNQANRAVSPARQVVASEPMKPAPDFRGIYSDNETLFIAHDRLNRKNLPMLYHYSFDQYYRTDLPVSPKVAISPEPQSRNNPNDLEARLRVLRQSMENGNRTVVPTAPSQDDSQQSAAVKIRRLPGTQGIVAIGD